MSSSSSPLSAEDSALSQQFVVFLQRMQFSKTLGSFAEELAALEASNNGEKAAAAGEGDDAPTSSATTDSSTTGGKQILSPSKPTLTSPKHSNNNSNGSPSSPKTKSGGSSGSGSPTPASAPGGFPTLVPQEGPFDHWGSGETGIISSHGDSSELWECEDYDSKMSPVYGKGAGLSQVEHGAERSSEPDMVPCNPYQKVLPEPGSLESFDMRVIYESGKTGFESAKEFPIVIGSIIAGRYQVMEYVGSAAFSRAVECVDLKYGHEVCMKIIRNGKDFFDQALDEVKLLQYINQGRDPDEAHVLQLYDYFYYKEHVFLVCELLRDNLYEFAKFNREEEEEFYFTLPRIRKIAKQCLTALAYIHSLNLLHCDLKPENILIKSYSRCEVKVIDFGSSCYTTDSLSSYIQSRCYRAPEVILGCKYDGGIDVWSLGAILPELITGHVMFQSDSVAGMLARITAVLGPLPKEMLYDGRHTCRFVTKHGVFYEYGKDDDKLVFHYPRRTQLSRFLGSEDPLFADFIGQCLTLDHKKRPSAAQLLQHPFILAADE